MDKNIFAKIKEKVKRKLSEGDSCHEWDHTERVYNLAIRIGKKEGADLDVLRLATIMHDIARQQENADTQDASGLSCTLHDS